MLDRLRRIIRARWLTEPIALLSTVPSAIAAGFLFICGLLLLVDLNAGEAIRAWLPWSVEAEAANSFLQAVAGGAITALSLAYSLTLVVFTLAASSIGPRLLKRFTSDFANQVTAGIFGGTFLYALLALYFTSKWFVPHLTIAVAGLLSILSVFQLIFFVRHVASSVTVDDEVAQIGAALRDDIEDLLKVGGEIPEDFTGEWREAMISAETDGYVGDIDEAFLVALAEERQWVMKLALPPGKFVIKGNDLIHVFAKGKPDLDDETGDKIRQSISLNPARSSDRGIEFSIHLLVEIALRALSPGTNDTFTAIACVDRLSAALRQPVESGLTARYRWDEGGVARLHVPGLSITDLIRTAFSPLRRASTANVLMAEHVATALDRLASVAHEHARPYLQEQADLLLADLRNTDILDQDLAFIEKRLGGLAGGEKTAPQTA